MKINVLIRTKGRPTLQRCIDSIRNQSYKDVYVWMLSDCDIDTPPGVDVHFITERKPYPFGYNEYCNLLKTHVNEGLFFFLDDDDYLLPDSLQQIADKASDCMIVQFSRNGNLKPSNDEIERKMIVNGRVGMPCLILSHKYKDIADIKPLEDGDFLWICDVLQKVEPTYHAFPVVFSEHRSFGI